MNPKKEKEKRENLRGCYSGRGNVQLMKESGGKGEGGKGGCVVKKAWRGSFDEKKGHRRKREILLLG